MAKNWTDATLNTLIPYKDEHIEDFQLAYMERIKFFANCAGWNVGGSYHPEPTYLYDITPTPDTAWDATHPDPTKGQGAVDNRFRYDAIHGLRGMLIGGVISPGNVGYYSNYTKLLSSYITSGMGNLYGHFIDETENINCVYRSKTLFLTDAIGSAAWNKNYLLNRKDISYKDINEIRQCFDKLQVALIPPSSAAHRIKTATGSNCATIAEAWVSAKTAFAAASWGSWTGGDGVYFPKLIAACLSGSNYYCRITAHETRHTFDLDLEISGMDWNIFPPSSAKLCISGLYSASDSTEVFCKCVETGATYSPPINETYGGYVLDSDITAYVGTGHGSETFTLSALNEFAETDLDKLAPTTTETKTAELYYLPVQNGDYTLSIIPHCYQCYVIIEPAWHYGKTE